MCSKHAARAAADLDLKALIHARARRLVLTPLKLWPCLQGASAPACAMLLTAWFAPKERGTYWGLWNSGQQL